MGGVGDITNWELINRTNYANPRVIKSVLYKFNQMEKIAENRDSVALAICADIKDALKPRHKVLTFKQRRYISLWWQGFDYVEIAAMYHKDPWTINQVVGNGIKNISKHLCKK